MAQASYPSRVPLAHLPTPIEEMGRLSAHLGGPNLHIKRDDKTGLALGGNKARKLEFLAADALEKGCDFLVTTGAPQSNHCRQTAAAAAALGLGCALVLRGEPPPHQSGNLLLDHLLNARSYWSESRPVLEVIAEVTAELESEGRRPYLIPLGGSNALGAAGYALAMEELAGQLASSEQELDAIVVASSSGGTQAGLLVGAQICGYEGEILGISIDHPASQLELMVSTLATATAKNLLREDISFKGKVLVDDSYLGQGYGILGSLEREAIQLTAMNEGILLDPVYTGRAMGGLIDLIRKGRFRAGQRLLFWHTGGTPALFAYGDQLA